MAKEKLVPISGKVDRETKTKFFDFCRARKETASMAIKRMIESELKT